MATLPSLAMIPAGYKAGKLYTQLPVNGAGDATVSRSSSATRVNSDGLIETVSNDVPRLDYSDGSCPALLVEPQITNLIEYSEDFSTGTGYWSVFRGTTTANAITSPSGLLNATRYEEDSATGQHFLRRTISITSGNDYTASCFFKANGFSTIRMRSDNQSEWAVDTTFDLDNGTYVASSGSADMIECANGWYRCIISGQASSSATTGIEIETSNGAGTPGSGVYLWGAMWEELSYVTSYIPTNGTTVTRLEDVISVSTTGLGLSEIVETFSDLTTNTISTIPSTYQISNGKVKSIIGT